MRPPELRTVLRVVSMVLLGFIGLIMVGLGTSVVVARSNWGQRKLLGVVVPLINQGLTGRVEIGGIGGDLLHRLVLRDLRLYDSETVLAASVREASVSYRLSALLHREVHITSAELKDAKLSARFLRDERLNLAALLKPGPPGRAVACHDHHRQAGARSLRDARAASGYAGAACKDLASS